MLGQYPVGREACRVCNTLDIPWVVYMQVSLSMYPGGVYAGILPRYHGVVCTPWYIHLVHHPEYTPHASRSSSSLSTADREGPLPR